MKLLIGSIAALVIAAPLAAQNATPSTTQQTTTTTDTTAAKTKHKVVRHHRTKPVKHRRHHTVRHKHVTHVKANRDNFLVNEPVRPQRRSLPVWPAGTLARRTQTPWILKFRVCAQLCDHTCTGISVSNGWEADVGETGTGSDPASPEGQSDDADGDQDHCSGDQQKSRRPGVRDRGVEVHSEHTRDGANDAGDNSCDRQHFNELIGVLGDTARVKFKAADHCLAGTSDSSSRAVRRRRLTPVRKSGSARATWATKSGPINPWMTLRCALKLRAIPDNLRRSAAKESTANVFRDPTGSSRRVGR